MKLPALFLNFKTYFEATANNALKLALIAEKLSFSFNVPIVLIVQATDLRLITSKVSIPVFAQHIEPINFGAHTGHILPESIAFAGAKGTILNHAENKQKNSFLEKAVCRAHESKLKVMLCAESLNRAKQFLLFKEKPDFIAIEPPQLIGSNTSVSSAKPQLILNAVKKINSIPVIVGAGIKSSEDISIALKLGAKGVLVSSGIIKAKNQKKALKELLKGFSF